jgi:hypothetical protein
MAPSFWPSLLTPTPPARTNSHSPPGNSWKAASIMSAAPFQSIRRRTRILQTCRILLLLHVGGLLRRSRGLAARRDYLRTNLQGQEESLLLLLLPQQ